MFVPSTRRRLGPVLALALVVGMLVPPAAAVAEPTPADTIVQSKRDVIPGQLVVRFRAGVPDADQRSALVTVGAEPVSAAAGLDLTLAKIDPADELRIRKELEGDPRIVYAEPNYRVQATADTRVPNDPEFSEQWALDNTGQYVGDIYGTPDADIDATEAWTVTTGSPGVVVAVVDTGIDFSNPDLGGGFQGNSRMWINPGEDCLGCRINGIDDDANGYVDDWHGWDFVNDDNNPFDDNGHGTHVAGILGATGDNGIGGTGVAWNVSLVALKFLDFAGGGSTYDAAEAILYAANMGFPITNNSWGGAIPAQVIADAIAYADQAGVLVVAAAGNDAFDNDDYPSYPASYDSPNVIAVAATNANDGLAYFSNYGARSVDIGAPGQSIYSTWTGVQGLPFAWLSGTSMATPMVSGAAALVRSRYPDADAVAIKTLLMSTVDETPALTGKVVSNGRLNVNRALRCDQQPTIMVESPFDGFAVEGGQPVDLVAYAGNCAAIDGVTVTATVNGTPLELTPRGDGTYTGTFTPETVGPVNLAVSASVGDRRLTSTISGAVVDNYVYRNVPYHWIEPRATGGYQIFMFDDDGSQVVDLPFPFAYYGVQYNQITVSTNGYAVFGPSAATSFANTELPNLARPNGVIAPFWDDFNPSAGGSIWWDVEGDAPNRQFVVAWEEVPHYEAVVAAYFELVLDEATGAITFQYQNVRFGDPTIDFGASATVGVEHPAGTVGRTFSSDRASLVDYEKHWGLQFVQASAGAPQILDFSLPQATVATEYSYTLQHQGGVEPVTWSIAEGELPPGLSLGPATGEISGVPTEAGSWPITVRVTDSAVPAQSAEQLLELDVTIGYQIAEIPYTWIDARDGGTDAGFTADDTSVQVELPFVFGFYDGEFDHISISTNGYIVFGPSVANSFSNTGIPNPTEPNGYAAAFWDDLSPEDGGGVWYKTVGEAPNRKFVAAWYDTPRYKQNGAATFEIVLEEGTNGIEFQYMDTNFEFSVYDFGASATIGLENPAGTSGTLFSRDEAVLQPYDGVTGLRFSVVANGTNAPFITSHPPLDGQVGVPYSYQPVALGAAPLTWELLTAPDGMTIESVTGALAWTATEPGDFPVVLQVSDANGSDVQEFTIHVTAGALTEATWEVAEGWMKPPGVNLSELGTLSLVQVSDNQRLEIGPAESVALVFDGSVPSGASIESLKIAIEYYESVGIPEGVVTWEVGTLPIDAPSILAVTNVEDVSGVAGEKEVSWNVAEWITTPEQSAALVFVVRNESLNGTIYIDHVHVDAAWTVP